MSLAVVVGSGREPYNSRLAVGVVSLYCGEDEDLVAHVTCTYALPPDALTPQEADEANAVETASLT